MGTDDRAALGPAVRWTSLVLHFADGSGLVSTWDAARGRAVQRDGPRAMTEPVATAEHLRALAELRDTGGCTNWVASTGSSAIEPPQLDAIDWAGFEAPASDQ